MKKAVLSLALAGCAALAVACSKDVPTSPVSSGKLHGSLPSNDIGVASESELQVCLSGTSPGSVTYNLNASAVTNLYGNEILNVGAAQAITPGNCIVVIKKQFENDNPIGSGIYPSARDVPVLSASVPGTWAYACTSPESLFCPNPAAGSGNSPGMVRANFYHGSTITFSFTANIPDPPSACVMNYPYTSATPRTSTVFSEDEVLAAFAYNNAAGEIRVWYADEHALTLGVRRVTTHGKTPPDVNQDFGIATMVGNVSSASGTPLAVGQTAISGLGAAIDPAGRPIFPALFMTDITAVPSSTSGDWQFGGAAHLPDKIYGTWKGAVLKIDNTKVPATSTFTVDSDPAKNNLTLGAGSNPAPNGVTTQGYTAEVVWKLSSLGLDPLKNYRLQFMVHDGDQNKGGGDVGEACFNVGPGIGDQVVVVK
jgi:hypothetical protein